MVDERAVRLALAAGRYKLRADRVSVGLLALGIAAATLALIGVILRGTTPLVLLAPLSLIAVAVASLRRYPGNFKLWAERSESALADAWAEGYEAGRLAGDQQASNPYRNGAVSHEEDE